MLKLRFDYQGLGIDPHSFTPEILLSLARVIRLPDLTAGQPLVVHKLTRSSTHADISFSFGLETGGELESEEYAWSDVVALKWRIVK